ncbi:asparagine synthase (glutamine-hydrolyzing) [Rhodocytophaga aerolata]|uniref:asparagine synthase (glutamine-hydrolyzing) n=1 Tax=Rhodocytophaga aerolata TaxID=455078 RepID=A0ABT8QYW0_9BACT|nr:asparagine synthase (glutamine-hydrolyzing) [Rhodocytophaga aerolata]MDO1445022.1 asparagine synthase (glutamine-hydrolyzing) [Rhodocytophaga aerolata]
MCGITGIYAFNEIGRFFMINMFAATDALSQRGPDSSGTFTHGYVGLGHRRLSIIDTSSDGRQPMTDETERYTIVFNGEIFNFPELKQQLEAKGYNFRSSSDTEVLLNLYIHEKENCLKHLNGFFAFAIYDKEQESLFIARDRMGIKPLLYFQDEDKLIFASEMKAVLAYGIPRELDYVSLQQYLQLNYIPAPHTIFKGVQKLLPGYYMYLKGNEVTTKPYYQIPQTYNRWTANQMSYEKVQSTLVELLEESVRKRLIADVPLGAFLSGGIDSSVIVALASKYTDHLNTFSIGYRDEPFFDETRYANLVAKKYKTNHTVFSLSNEDLYEHLFDMLDYTDEPFADSSALAVYILSKRTRKRVTVALSGDGADELFGGYNKHQGEYKVREGGLMAGAVKTLQPLWDVLPKSRNSTFGNKVRQLQKFAEGMSKTEKERYWRFCTFVNEENARHVLSNQSLQLASEQAFEERKNRILKHLDEDGDFNEFLYTDMQLVLPNDMLTKVDLMSMAHGLEIRVPFLDYTVVNFAFSLPAEFKVDGTMKKRIVQDAFRSHLPKELYNRPKQGFEVPLLKWFRNELQPLITNDLLKDDFIQQQGIFNVDNIRELKEKLFSSNPEDVHARIWGLLVFQYWWKKYM